MAAISAFHSRYFLPSLYQLQKMSYVQVGLQIRLQIRFIHKILESSSNL